MAKKAILCSRPWEADCPYMKLKNWIRPVCSYPNVRTKTELIETVTGNLLRRDLPSVHLSLRRSILMTIEKLEPGFYCIGEHDISFTLNKKTWKWRATDLTTGESIEFSRTKCEAVIKFLDWLCDLSKKSSKFKEVDSDD